VDDETNDDARVVITRRHFIKTVIAGTAVGLGGCPVVPKGADAGTIDALARDAGAMPAAPMFTKTFAGENFDRCHMVRDGLAIPTAPTVTEEVEVVIVGGGPSGLFAAHRMRDRDVLLLEKEQETGGNCRLDEWNGIKMSTGGAFYTESEHSLIELLNEIGAKGTRVDGPDSLVINGQPTRDFFRDGANQLPFAQKVRDDFKRSRDDLLKLYKTKKDTELDAVSFAKLLEPYSVEVKQFWDSFGQSNWGGTTENTSGYVGAEAYTWAGGAEDPRFTFPGGLSGAALKLAEVVRAKLGDRLRTGCPVFKIDVEQSATSKGKRATAVVHYFDEQSGAPKSVRAKAVVLAAPKYFAKHLVRAHLASLPGPASTARIAELNAIRYLPFVIFNVCMNSVGPEPAYDNFFIDTPFTDFVPADWIVHAGKGPKERKTALTVYHPLPEGARATLLVDELIANYADGVVTHLERHIPGTREKIAEIRAFRRGHAMYISTPGRIGVSDRVSEPAAPIFFANTDCGLFSTFYDAVNAGARSTALARKYLGLKVDGKLPEMAKRP